MSTSEITSRRETDYVSELTAVQRGKRPKGYAGWSPHKKTQRTIAQVQEVLSEYRAHLPLTARQIFYRLVGAYGYPKTEKDYARLCEYLVRGRRARMIRFEDIRDDGATLMASEHYAGEEDFYGHVQDMAKGYKRDKLANQDVNIRVYCEAAGMMPQLRRVCEPYSIPVYSCSGFDSLTAKHGLKSACAAAYTYLGRKTVILHLGDHDPSGESIFSDGLVKDVHAFLLEDIPHKDPRDVADFERVALTAEQAQNCNLDPAPAKQSDSRSRRWGGKATYQLEALPPDTLAELLEVSILSRLDLEVYEWDLEIEAEERRRIAKALPGGK